MPHWTKTPNAILDSLPKMGAAEIRITFVLVRQIYGYHQEQVKLTYAELMRLSGLGSRASINAGIKQVLSRGFFRRDESRQLWSATGQTPEPSMDRSRSGQRMAVRGKTGVESRRPRPERPYARAEAVPIPERLDSPEFRELWFGYLSHLRELSHPLTPTSARANLRRLGAVGREEASARLSRAIERNWRSLFYPGDEAEFLKRGSGAQVGPEEEAWRQVCRLAANGALAVLSPGAVRQAVVAVGEDRLYRMSRQARPFIKREFLEALHYARHKTG